MMKRSRYFFRKSSEEKWLNKMAKAGFRLVSLNNLNYVFEKCEPSEYEYKIDFVGHKTLRDFNEYVAFMEEMDMKTFSRSSAVRFTTGKVRFRPWAGKGAKITTSSGNFNKEWLIVERKCDGTKFELHTDYKDLIEYYRYQRKAYLTAAIMVASIAVFGESTIGGIEDSIFWIKVFAGSISAGLCSAFGVYSARIREYKKRIQIYG